MVQCTVLHRAHACIPYRGGVFQGAPASYFKRHGLMGHGSDCGDGPFAAGRARGRDFLREIQERGLEVLALEAEKRRELQGYQDGGAPLALSPLWLTGFRMRRRGWPAPASRALV